MSRDHAQTLGIADSDEQQATIGHSPLYPKAIDKLKLTTRTYWSAA
jgi:hypothetical protein